MDAYERWLEAQIEQWICDVECRLTRLYLCELKLQSLPSTVDRLKLIAENHSLIEEFEGDVDSARRHIHSLR